MGDFWTPVVFGQFALLSAFFGTGLLLGDFGLRSYLIRGSDLPDDRVAAAVALSWVISGALCLCGLAVAFLGRAAGWSPGLPMAAVVPLSFGLLILPLALSTEVRLQRAMDFALISRLEVLRVLTEVVVGIALALSGLGVVALAWGLLAGHAAYSVALVCLGRTGAGLRPRTPPRLAEWGLFSGFGIRLTATQLLPRLSEIATVSLVTGLLGAATMGLLNRAQTIQRIMDRTLFDGLLPVVLPAMSGALARGVAPLEVYRRQISYLTAVCWPGFACIALLAEPLVLVLLGRDWQAATPGVRLLALAGLGLPFTKMSQKFFVAVGLVDRYLRITLATQLIGLILVAWAATVSFEAVCLAIAMTVCVKGAVVGLSVRHRFGAAPGHLRRLAGTGAIIVAATGAGPLAVLSAGLPHFVELGLAVAAAALGWYVALRLMRHPLGRIVDDMARLILTRARR